jgi:hypothetical protein
MHDAALAAAENLPFSEGYGLQAVHNSFEISAALAAEGVFQLSHTLYSP